MDTQADHDLVAASIAGDPRAYGELARRHSRRVFATCLAILGSFEDAEDMAQDALVRGFEHLSGLRDAKAW